MAGILTEEQLQQITQQATQQATQQIMQHVMPTVQNQILQQIQQPPGAAATTPSGRKMTLHPKCFSRLDKFAGGAEATATQNATVFEILNWIEENGEHTFGEIMETDPEGIQNGRFNGMETIDKEIFQHLVLSTEGEAKMVVKAVENADGFVAYSRLHAKYSRRTVARIMRIHKGCMYPSQVKDVKLLTSAIFQWEDKWNAMLKEMKDLACRCSGRWRRSWSCVRMISRIRSFSRSMRGEQGGAGEVVGEGAHGHRGSGRQSECAAESP